MRHLLILIKARITTLVTLTAMAGYGLAPGATWGRTLVAVTLGVFFITAGASTVNMFLERRTDALMDRTRERPLPQNLIRPGTALGLGLVVSVVGLLILRLLEPGLRASPP